MRSLLATLFLSQGIPMLVAGDEMGRSQGGNNNAYAQDNEISWLDWDGADQDLLDFTRRLVGFGRGTGSSAAALVRGSPLHGEGVGRSAGIGQTAVPMTAEDWRVSYAKSLGVYLNGSMIPARDPQGEPVVDDSFLLLFNSGGAGCEFTIPEGLQRDEWTVELVASDGNGEGQVIRGRRSDRRLALVRGAAPSGLRGLT